MKGWMDGQTEEKVLKEGEGGKKGREGSEDSSDTRESEERGVRERGEKARESPFYRNTDCVRMPPTCASPIPTIREIV